MSASGGSGAGPAAVGGSGDGSSPAEEVSSYYGQPALKEPVWTWEIPTYFFSGGVAGGSAGLAYLSELRGNEVLARRAWAVALGGMVASPALLISDLGRPVRFLNMLRMFKVTSPMSVGSWIISGAGAATGVAAVNAWTGLFPASGRIAKPAAALLGLPLSTYTGALVANTAIPAWHTVHRLLPFVFGSGAALSAGAIAVMVTPPDRAAPARRLAVGAAMAEGPLMEIMTRRAGEHREAYRTGAASRFSNLSRACIVSGTSLLAARGASSRVASSVAGALLCTGALATRWAVFRAGFNSVRDPKYVLSMQRRGVQRGERRGAARTQAKVATADRRLGSPATTV